MRTAALWRRALAVCADAATVFSLLWALVVVQLLWFMDDLSQSVDPAPWGDNFVPTLAFALAFAVYEIVFLAWNNGRTPGKEMLRLQVVGADGECPRLGRCVRRALAVAPLWMVPPVWLGLGLVLVAAAGLPAVVDRRARSWPDWLSGTDTTRFDAVVAATHSRLDVHLDAAPPTVFTLLIGRKNARRFARSKRDE